MTQIIQLPHVAATVLGFISFLVISEIVRKVRSKKPQKKVVGVITPSEINQSIMFDENDIKQRSKDLQDMPISKFNNTNNMHKARAGYQRDLQQLSEDRDSLLY